MAETTFLKTVTFGGYEKQDVEKRFRTLCEQISELQCELREAKLSLTKFRTGADAEKTYESVLKEERDRLKKLQAENITLNEKLKAYESESAQKDEKIKTLENSVAELEHMLSESDMKMASFQAKDDVTALSVVFAEAKKSAKIITESATKKAEELAEDSRKLAENIVAEANNKASEIVYDAEVYASEMMAEVENQTSEMKNSSGNLKALLLDDANVISKKFNELRKALENSEKLLSKTIDTLTKDGVPVFEKAEKVEPDLPEKPVYEKTDYAYHATKKSETTPKKVERQDDFELAQERVYSGSYKYTDDDGEPMPNFEQLNAGIVNDYEIDVSVLAKTQRSPAMMRGGIDLEALTKQAEEFVGMKKKENSKPSARINLDDLAKMAREIDDTPSETEKTGGSLNLDDLAKMAREIDDTPSKTEKTGRSLNLDDLARMASEIID
ncbi:MAG: hypothetical protein K2J08_12860 [Ruminococcus sp.]|nr:hypothetical protein [Ruminococcus sp.]